MKKTDKDIDLLITKMKKNIHGHRSFDYHDEQTDTDIDVDIDQLIITMKKKTDSDTCFD